MSAWLVYVYGATWGDSIESQTFVGAFANEAPAHALASTISLEYPEAITVVFVEDSHGERSLVDRYRKGKLTRALS